jgi:hypothetical protein
MGNMEAFDGYYFLTKFNLFISLIFKSSFNLMIKRK